VGWCIRSCCHWQAKIKRGFVVVLTAAA